MMNTGTTMVITVVTCNDTSCASSQDDIIQEEEEGNQQINILTVIDSTEQQDNPTSELPQGHRTRYKLKATKKRPSYPQYRPILDQEEYIHGRRSKRNVRFEKAETLITNGNTEKAKKKPIIRGLCQGYMVRSSFKITEKMLLN